MTYAKHYDLCTRISYESPCKIRKKRVFVNQKKNRVSKRVKECCTLAAAKRKYFKVN